MSWLALSVPFLIASRAFAQSSAPFAAVATTTSMPFPTATLSNSDTQSFLTSNWGLSKGRIQNGASNLAFVQDPFPDSPVPNENSTTTGPVLQVTYPKGSFSDDNSGGAQMYSLWNTSGDTFESMMLTYEVAFDEDYDWVKGGKLPGLRGGKPNGCSGGNQADGVSCFSTRLMWRTEGQGEIYAYIPRPNNICDEENVLCNDEFGASIGRGDFSFSSGRWNKVSLSVQMNNPVDIANGQAEVFFNNVPVITQSDLQFRSDLNLTPSGLYFSTFFGGNDASWSPPADTHTYFRNMRLVAGTQPSTLHGTPVGNSASSTRFSSTLVPLACVLMGIFFI
ncbi:hypothetical protein OF83DRAFT_1138322 [Amylostereum chailletii]|nr:hypothetical protein OF83DRAFT_1138322 [Amylostereum chailletii]